MSAALEAAHASQDEINAFISLDDDRALASAQEIDAARAAGEEVGPLAGVPIALKDLIDHAGRVTTAGSSFHAETAKQTAPCVERLERAGAVIIGRTNLHEWAFGFNSENEHWGAVRNPWDTATSAGGSSGGSAAAVAAGITPIAIGTDTGGSVRVPAALCGTFGLKVSYGRIPLEGVFPLVPSVDTVGPLANSMENIEVSYRVMSGDLSPLSEPRSLRVGVPEPWFGDAPLDEANKTAFDQARESLRGLGHEVHPIEMPDVKPSRHLVAALEEVASVHREFRLQGKHYGEAVEARLIAVEEVTAEEVAEARKWQAMIRQRFADAFATVDLLITPTVPAGPKVIGEEMIGDRNHRAVLSYFTSIVNHALHPALAAPLSGAGAPPTSLQLVGPMGGDAALIAVGKILEREGVCIFDTAPGWSRTTERPG